MREESIYRELKWAGEVKVEVTSALDCCIASIDVENRRGDGDLIYRYIRCENSARSRLLQTRDRSGRKNVLGDNGNSEF